MNSFYDLFIVAFGEIDIPPLFLALIIFLTLFIFIAVLISTAKLIQSLLNDSDWLFSMIVIGTAGFEPTTPTTPKWCATKLRYVPFFFKLSQLLADILNIWWFPFNSSLSLTIYSRNEWISIFIRVAMNRKSFSH